MTKDEIIDGFKNNTINFKKGEDSNKNNKEIVLIAVQQNGKALLYASEELQNDKEVVLAAIQQEGTALQYASKEFKNDKDVVLEAVKQNEEALKYASEAIQDEIGENNPVKYLESYLLQQKLINNLNKKALINKKLKI